MSAGLELARSPARHDRRMGEHLVVRILIVLVLLLVAWVAYIAVR